MEFLYCGTCNEHYCERCENIDYKTNNFGRTQSPDFVNENINQSLKPKSIPMLDMSLFEEN